MIKKRAKLPQGPAYERRKMNVQDKSLKFTGNRWLKFGDQKWKTAKNDWPQIKSKTVCAHSRCWPGFAAFRTAGRWENKSQRRRRFDVLESKEDKNFHLAVVGRQFVCMVENGKLCKGQWSSLGWKDNWKKIVYSDPENCKWRTKTASFSSLKRSSWKTERRRWREKECGNK